MLIKIRPKQVLTYPSDVFAEYLKVEAVNVLILDSGIDLHYTLLDSDEQIIVGQKYLLIENEDLCEWTTKDDQLIDIILKKLELEKNDED